MLLRTTLGASLIIFCASTAIAETVSVPATAKKVTKDEFVAFIDGKSVEVIIYDLEKPVTALLTWNWKKNAITGAAVIDGKKKIKVRTKWTFDGDKVCADGNCHDIYVDGSSFYEVRPDGAVHAFSTIK